MAGKGTRFSAVAYVAAANDPAAASAMAGHVGDTAGTVARVIEETATRHTIKAGWAGRDGHTVG